MRELNASFAPVCVKAGRGLRAFAKSKMRRPIVFVHSVRHLNCHISTDTPPALDVGKDAEENFVVHFSMEKIASLRRSHFCFKLRCSPARIAASSTKTKARDEAGCFLLPSAVYVDHVSVHERQKTQAFASNQQRHTVASTL